MVRKPIFLILILTAFVVSPLYADVYISEFVASNYSGITDEDGETNDWIEIYNSDSTAVNLDGYYLTNDKDLLTKWQLPSVAIAGYSYLVVHASEKNRINPATTLHTNFTLGAGGDYLALVKADGTTVVSDFGKEYPQQRTDVSYGLTSISGTLTPVFYTTPTPNYSNSLTYFTDIVEKPTVNRDHGFYEGPFSLTIETETVGAQIRYTLDGSEPTETTGLIYTAPLSITTTTALRAKAFKTGQLASDLLTSTYIYVDDVAQQPASIPGWPTNWGIGSNNSTYDRPADYEMDPRVVNNTLPGYSIREALLDIPTIAITMEQEDFIGKDNESGINDSSNGIYNHGQSRWERKCTFEYILPNGDEGPTEDCKIEVQGNWSRRPWVTQKHSMRVTFTKQYGISKINYPFFPESDVTEYNQLIMRNTAADAWSLVGNSWKFPSNSALYVRDIWMKERFRAMGHTSPYGNYSHVYVNGVYFGIHNLTEKIKAEFYANHEGGEPEDWDVNENFETRSPRWYEMEAVAASAQYQNGPAGYELIKPYLDVDNFCDYVFLHYMSAAMDWNATNGSAAANMGPEGDGKFRFTVWDQESNLRCDHQLDFVITRGNYIRTFFVNLCKNPEFLINFNDRVQKHFFNNGVVNVTNSQNELLRVAGWIDKAIVAESARWGDVKMKIPYSGGVVNPSDPTDYNDNYYPPVPNGPDYYFTREGSWLVELNNMVDNYFPNIHDPNYEYSTIKYFRKHNIFPSIDAPIYHINSTSQHGGYVEIGDSLTISNPDALGIVYYTTDGSDPRQPGGAVNPAATTFSTGQRQNQEETLITKSDNWNYLYNGSDQGSAWTSLSFNDSSWLSGPAELGFNDGDEATDIGPKVNGNITAYFRKKFTVNNLDDFSELRFSLTYDDGAVVYINGTEVNRYHMPTGTIDYQTLASNGTGDNKQALMTNISPSLLVSGENIITVSVHQASATSSDLSFNLELKALVSTTISDPDTITVANSTHIKSRILNGSEWSALSEAKFAADDIKDELRVTELMYNPEGDVETEYIELQNIGTEVINLNLANFSNGIEFTFPNSVLAPNAFILVVKNELAFRTKYPDFSGIIAGEFTGSLSDSGERITLDDAAGEQILSFKYSDSWYKSSDGAGFSLNVRDKIDTTNLSDKSGWSYSTYKHGTPGAEDLGPVIGNLVINEISTAGSRSFVEIYNLSDSEVNISNWTISGIEFTFPDGTLIGSEEAVVIAANPSLLSLNDGVQTWEWGSAVLDPNGELLQLMTDLNVLMDEVHYSADSSWAETSADSSLELKKSSLNNASGTSWRKSWYKYGSPGEKNTLRNPIILTEIFYNPPAELGVDGDYEFLEIYNRGDFTMDLSGYEMSDGIGFTFPANSSIAPNEYILLTSKAATYSGNGYQVFQWSSGSLSNSGEILKLEDTDSFKVFEVEYGDSLPWPILADGGGSSLLLKDLLATDLNDATKWLASEIGATSPGDTNQFSEQPQLIINEILAHTDWPQVDFVEIYNPMTYNVNIAGWWLTDDVDNIEKYQIPVNTIVKAGEYIVIYEDNDGNPNNNAQLPPEFFGSQFSLSSHGEEIYLFSPTKTYSHGFEFPASENGYSFGRYINSAGDELFPVASAVSDDTDNAHPLINEVVISEIMYHPEVSKSEFVEIYNSSTSSVKLYDEAYPTNCWKVEGIDFTFPENTILASKEAVILVPISTNITLFRADYNLSQSVQIFHFMGSLSNSGERLTLLRPDKPDEAFVPYITVDSVRYNDKSPWPEGSDGGGSSLLRKYPLLFADDPTSWELGQIGGSPGDAQLVPLTVENGTGSGSYFIGSVVEITANNHPDANFASWSENTDDPQAQTTTIKVLEPTTVSVYYEPTIYWQDPADMTYGTPLSSVQLNASAEVLGTMSYATPVDPILTVGTYELTATFTPTDTSIYVTSTKTVSVNIVPAPLTYTAENKQSREGDSLPNLTYRVSGFVNGDNEESVVTGGAPILSTTATNLSVAGSYDIYISTANLSSELYQISGQSGTMLIYESERPLNVTINLNPGWNLISQPYSNLTFSDCFSDDHLLSTTYNWGDYYIPNAVTSKPETEVGYWLFSFVEQSQTISGTQPESKDNILPNDGWNLIGTLTTTNASDFGSNPVWVWNSLSQYYEVAKTLEPGIGYWIYK